MQIRVIVGDVYGESSFDLSTITGAGIDPSRARRESLRADSAQGTKAFDVSIHFESRACLVLGRVIIHMSKAMPKKSAQHSRIAILKDEDFLHLLSIEINSEKTAQ